MERIFRTRADWFEVRIRPALLRRTLIGAVIIGLCAVWWSQTRTWIPLTVITLVIAERAYEFLSIPSTRKIVASNTITASDRGLLLSGARFESGVLYPWSSLRASLIRAKDGAVDSITIADTARRGSKVRLLGYEAMDELGSLIEKNAVEP